MDVTSAGGSARQAGRVAARAPLVADVGARRARRPGAAPRGALAARTADERWAGPSVRPWSPLAVAAAVEVVLPRYVRRAFIEEAYGSRHRAHDRRRPGHAEPASSCSGSRRRPRTCPAQAPRRRAYRFETRDLRPQRLTATGMADRAGRALERRWRRRSRAGGRASMEVRAERGLPSRWSSTARTSSGAAPSARTRGSRPAMFTSTLRGRTASPPSHGDVEPRDGRRPREDLLGPWRVDLDREPGAARARVALDPERAGRVHASSSSATAQSHQLSADLVMPRSPIARLGIPQALLGLHGDIQLEAGVHYARLRPQARERNREGRSLRRSPCAG